MLTSFLIMFRESLEASLIVGIILGYLARTKQQKYNNIVYLGIISGIVSSVIFAYLFSMIAGGFEGVAEQVFEGATMVIGAALLTFMIFWMMKQKNVSASYHKRMQRSIEAGASFGLFTVGFISILREGVETVIFLNAARFAAGSTSILGAFLGIIAAIVLGYVVFTGMAKVSVKRFFNVSSIVLVLFAAGLVSHGIHEFQEAGVIPVLHGQAWDINPLLNPDGSFPWLHEEGIIGSILKGLFGYNGNPSILEVMSYGVYLGGIFIIYNKMNRISSVPDKS
ncbi:FTR1 family protein [Candidatus Woesearchaeota archaeon]|nr:FTR1 family protein [Candidatus Woesearchaeota archaeon]